MTRWELSEDSCTMAAAKGDFPAIESEMTGHDHLVIRCPRLGGQVTFAYCRREEGVLPCRRTIICWQGRFPVAAFLQTVLAEEEWHRWTNQRPQEKVTTLLELIEAAKERLRGEEDLMRHQKGEEP